MTASKPKRPWSFRIFCLWIAVLGLISLTRAAILFWQMPTLAQLGLPTRWAMAVLSAVWGLGLVAGAVGLWLRREPARWAVLALVPAHYVSYGVYLLVSTKADYGQSRLGPYTVLALLATGFSTWFLTWRRTREMFQRQELRSS
jgi:hypothetical protein